MKNLIDTSENMTTKYYTIDIKIYNDIGELAEKQLRFPTLDDMSLALWTHNTIDKMINEATDYAKENNMVIEDMVDKDDYIEDMSPTSPLNNPANFAN